MPVVVTAGAAAVVAIIVAGGIRHAGQAQPPVTGAIEADQVLNAAALQAAARPAVRPRPDQWIYTSVVSYSLGGGRTSSESWLRFGGDEEAYYQDGRLIVHQTPAPAGPRSSPLARFLGDPTPATAYAALASLPTDHVALLAEVAERVSPPSIAGSGWDPTGARPTRAQLEFGFLADLLWNAAETPPPRAEAAVFHAIASIPGVDAQQGVKDALGRPVIALSIGGVDQQLMLDPRTYQVIGERTLSNGNWPAPASKDGQTVPKGDLVQSLVWATTALVRAPGER